MRAQAEIEPLRSAVEYAAQVVKRSHVPIMGCLRIKAADNSLRLTGTDGTTFAFARCDGAVADAGDVAVDAAPLKAFLAAVAGPVSLSEVDGKLTLSASGAEAMLMASDPRDMPSVSKPGSETEIDAVDAMTFCAPYVEKDIQNSVYSAYAGLRIDAQSVSAVGDHRKLIAHASITGGPDEVSVIPGAALPAALKALKGGRLFLSPNSWRVEAEDRSLAGRTMEPYAANLRPIIEGRGPVVATCDADDLRDAIAVAALGGAPDCRFDVSEGDLTLTGEERGNAFMGRRTITADGRAATFILPMTQMSTAARSLSGSVIEIATDGRAAIYLSPIGTDRSIVVQLLLDHRTQLPSAEAAAA